MKSISKRINGCFSFFTWILLAAATPGELSAKMSKPPLAPGDVAVLSPVMRSELAGLQYLLNPLQIRQFLHLPSDSLRAEWIKVFWKASDPTPATPKNEMKREHTVRVRLAGQFFKIDRWPGWDKRGEIFIRYGPPSFRGKVWGEVTHRRIYPPREIWFYKDLDMLLSFENFNLRGEFILAIDPLGPAEKISPGMVEFLLYDTTQDLSSRFSLEAFEPGRGEIIKDSIVDQSPKLPENIDALMDPDSKEMTPKETAIIFQKDKLREKAENFETTLDRTPSAYPFNFSKNKSMPFFFDINQFKTGSGLNRVEIHIELAYKSPAADGEVRPKVKLTAVVLNDKFNGIERQEKSILVGFDKTAEPPTKLIPLQFVFSLPKGYYRIDLAASEEATQRSSSYRTTLSVEEFTDVLSVSDIIFARSIKPTTRLTSFTRGPLEIIPHPLHAYKKGFVIPIYFEIYNLRLDWKGTSAYTIEYKIAPKTFKKYQFWDRYKNIKPVVSSSFTGSGSTKDEPHHLSIRTDNFAKGSFDLFITVKDENAQMAAFRKTSFSILD